jgi:hypothetical protein
MELFVILYIIPSANWWDVLPAITVNLGFEEEINISINRVAQKLPYFFCIYHADTCARYKLVEVR